MCSVPVPVQNGKMGIALNIEYLQPWTDSAVDKAAAVTGLESALGWFADPLWFGEHLGLSTTLQLLAAKHAPAVCCDGCTVGCC